MCTVIEKDVYPILNLPQFVVKILIDRIRLVTTSNNEEYSL